MRLGYKFRENLYKWLQKQKNTRLGSNNNFTLVKKLDHFCTTVRKKTLHKLQKFDHF